MKKLLKLLGKRNTGEDAGEGSALRYAPCVGFTLLELLIVIGVTLLIALAAISTQGTLIVNSHLDSQLTQIVETLRLAKSHAESGFMDSAWGVYFDDDGAGNNDRFVLFKGSDYALRDVSFDVETQLPDVISIFSLSLNGGGKEVVFDKLTGMTSQYGSLVIADSLNQTRAVTINAKGLIFY